jgi:hypothetical protein
VLVSSGGETLRPRLRLVLGRGDLRRRTQKKARDKTHRDEARDDADGQKKVEETEYQHVRLPFARGLVNTPPVNRALLNLR